MRLKHRAKIRLMLPSGSQEYLVDMKDFSEGGLFLVGCPAAILNVGSLVTVQTTELEDAPVQAAKVVRVDEGGGVGLEFVF